MSKDDKTILDTEVVGDKLSRYRELLTDRKELIKATLASTPKEEDFGKDTVLGKFLEFYTVGEARRCSDTITSTMSLKKDTIELLQEKQISIRHLKLFIENIGTQREEMEQELKDNENTFIEIDNGEFDESVLDNLNLGV